MVNISENSVNNKNFRKGKTNNPNGRPKGTKNKPCIRDYISLKEVDELLQTAKSLAMNGDSKLLIFLLTQIFGRPDFAVEIASKELPVPIMGGMSRFV